MPLELRPMTPADTLSWTRIRALAYYGPTHDLLHTGPISESSIRGVAEDRKREFQKPNTWYWKVVDTDLKPSDDDPSENGGKTIAISVWSMHNVKKEEEESNEPAVPTEKVNDKPGFMPPELRLDALGSLFAPFGAAREEIMGTDSQFLMLNTLATYPEHQGRGAARLLLDWGMKKADQEGLVSYLDASATGRPIYEKRGFRLVKSIEWDRVPWGGEGKDWHGCMVRKVGGKAV
ncbi:hypothetical protein EJ02DRAFT_371250 [Clathrospora elynae]|uniref:N-acetyltransferase domain-containing protein n=1 Tax=Clathrospora elynae TaxID=706981 RepID=A0A6A5SYI4_9PLEO|nr:hypothetical protein EJ02DRAFT_371250 [Clathrospora elynae]